MNDIVIASFDILFRLHLKVFIPATPTSHQTNRSPGYIELNDASEADDLQPSQGRDLPGQTSHGATQSHSKLPVYQGSRMMNGENNNLKCLKILMTYISTNA